MAEDLKFYESQDSQEVLSLPISFDPVIAGEEQVRSVFVENTSDGRASFDDVRIVGNQVSVESFVEGLDSGQRSELMLRFEPNLSDKEPVEAEIVFDYSLVYM